MEGKPSTLIGKFPGHELDRFTGKLIQTISQSFC